MKISDLSSCVTVEIILYFSEQEYGSIDYISHLYSDSGIDGIFRFWLDCASTYNIWSWIDRVTIVWNFILVDVALFLVTR